MKVIAKHLLDIITGKLMLDWRKRQRSRSAARVAVGQALDAIRNAIRNNAHTPLKNANCVMCFITLNRVR